VFELLRGTEHVLFAHRVHADVISKLRRELDPSLVRVVIADQGEELDSRYQLDSGYRLGRAIWVVRPDGYIGFRQSGDDPEPVLAWMRSLFAVEELA
jgi:hypothetical protein